MITLNEILNSGANVSFTITAKELRDFLHEVATSLQQTIKEDEQYLSVDEVCALTKKVRSTLWIWEKRGYLVPASRIGKVLRYKKSDVIKLMESTNGK